jgi:hypothetical protein
VSVLLITHEDQLRINEMVADARKNYIPWEVLQPTALVDHNRPVVTLEERKPGSERPQSQHIDLGSYTVAFSFEEQPAGICRHLSVSVDKPGKLPSRPAVEMVCKAFGFTNFPPDGGVWVEEYSRGEFAINAVEVAVPYGKA